MLQLCVSILWKHIAWAAVGSALISVLRHVAVSVLRVRDLANGTRLHPAVHEGLRPWTSICRLYRQLVPVP
jgi:hypothetical protein